MVEDTAAATAVLTSGTKAWEYSKMLYDEEEGKKQLGDKYEENQDHGTVEKVHRMAFLVSSPFHRIGAKAQRARGHFNVVLYAQVKPTWLY